MKLKISKLNKLDYQLQYLLNFFSFDETNVKLENQQIVEYDQLLQQFYFLPLLSQLKHLNQMMQVKVPEINSISIKIEKKNFKIIYHY